MKILVTLLIAVTLAGCSERELRDAVERIEEAYGEAPLTQGEVVEGLKQALTQGIGEAAASAARRDGYYADNRLRIPFPPDVRRVDETLRRLGLGSEVDRFVRRLNRGAELAADEAKPIFVDAIRAMTIRDAFDVLNGPPDAATRYLERTSSDRLHAAFLPIVREQLGASSATRYYRDIVNQYNRIPLVEKVDPDLDEYATRKAIDGLFVLVADEEANIRANPVARTTALLRRVFGSLD